MNTMELCVTGVRSHAEKKKEKKRKKKEDNDCTSQSHTGVRIGHRYKSWQKWDLSWVYILYVPVVCGTNLRLARFYIMQSVCKQEEKKWKWTLSITNGNGIRSYIYSCRIWEYTQVYTRCVLEYALRPYRGWTIGRHPELLREVKKNNHNW